MSDFRDRLLEAMRIKEINQAELSKRTGLSKPRISQYVNGIYEAKQDALSRLAEALDVDIVWLMGYDVPMERQLSDSETAAFEAGTILGKAARDPDQIHLLQTYQGLDKDNQGKVIQFADALALLPKPGATP